jgi:hypothetical protein
MKKFWNIIVPHGQVLKNVINWGSLILMFAGLKRFSKKSNSSLAWIGSSQMYSIIMGNGNEYFFSIDRA